jgi:hypothetical protein
VQRRLNLTQKAERGLYGGMIVTAVATVLAWDRGVQQGVITLIVCSMGVALAVLLVQLVTRPSSSSSVGGPTA